MPPQSATTGAPSRSCLFGEFRHYLDTASRSRRCFSVSPSPSPFPPTARVSGSGLARPTLQHSFASQQPFLVVACGELLGRRGQLLRLPFFFPFSRHLQRAVISRLPSVLGISLSSLISPVQVLEFSSLAADGLYLNQPRTYSDAASQKIGVARITKDPCRLGLFPLFRDIVSAF